jgi:gamma-glutamyltranspeptidase / glutathione hydrolase
LPAQVAGIRKKDALLRDFHQSGRSPVYSVNGMAATSMPIASLTAIDVLRAGGNAVDAAVAACAVLAVVEPQSTGLGGDCFCLYAPPSGKVVAVNGSGRSAAGASLDAIRGSTPPEDSSPHGVTIPGAVSGWQLLLDAHGTKGLDELLLPAIRCAEDGFPVHPRVAWDWSMDEAKLRRAGNTLFLPGGHAPREGDRFVQTALATTLRAIAKRGAKAFYGGPIAADMAATLKAAGGVQTEEDFANGLKGAEFVEPISLQWRGLDVWQCPPNGPGLVSLMILGELEALGEAPDGPAGVTRFHRHIEAARMAYRDRGAFLADPRQRETPLDRLLSQNYLAWLAKHIDDQRSLPALPAPGEIALAASGNTVTLSVVDRDGGACSLINSIYQTFGSGILAAGSGVLMQNRGLCFTFEPGHPNSFAPNTRPAHTIMPGLVTREGKAAVCFGVMGAHYQPMGQTWILSNAVEYGMDIQQALDFPRVCPHLGEVEIERGVPTAMREKLAALGHVLTEVERPLGGGQAIMIDRERGVLIGGSDPRKDGAALGY